MFSLFRTKASTDCRPRVLLLADRRGWAYDICARNLVAFQSDRFDFDIRYVRERPRLELSRYDLLYVYFWGETYHQRFMKGTTKVIKEISSHRWEDDPTYGPCSPSVFSSKYLNDASAVICTSQRLYDMISPLRPGVHHASNGYDSRLFQYIEKRVGEPVLGWAGNRADSVKRVDSILEPAAKGYRLLMANGDLPRDKMNHFFNRIDVFAVASKHEGTPLPLLEAMAAGCFPVCTDVGVVPEIIQHGENGLIVEPSVKAFRDAFAWCSQHIDTVRARGADNALQITNRSWENVSERFGDILVKVLS